jgi:probable HAF family extracellular repeat protein
MSDLNSLIPPNSGWTLSEAFGINDTGQITGTGAINGATHAFLLNPVVPYNAYVQQPINPEGSSIFNASRGVIPVKFTLSLNGTATCQLPPATISLTRTAGAVLGTVDESTYLQAADSGANFRISGFPVASIFTIWPRSPSEWALIA